MNNSNFLELCMKGSLQQINDAIRSGVSINARGNDGATALMFAAMGSNPEVIAALINAGADSQDKK